MSSASPAAPLAHSTVGEDGDGPVVVFCHGLLGRGRNFSGIAKALQPDFRCVLLDMPDHGSSPWTERVDYERNASMVIDQLRSLDLGPVQLVGHSMGGKTAMMVALMTPELVQRLVVVDISPTGSGETSEFEHLLSAMASVDLSSVGSLGEAGERLAEAVPSANLRGFLLQNLRRDARTKQFDWQPNLEVLLRDLDTVTGDIPHQDRTYDGPVLWLSGSESSYVNDQAAPQMRRLFPRTFHVSIKDAGHWLHSEQPEAFTATLRHFLRER